jgi:hypothetical protein
VKVLKAMQTERLLRGQIQRETSIKNFIVHCIAMILDRDHDDNSYNNKLQKEEQIPTEYNEEETLRVIRKQNNILGEGKRSKTFS